MNLSPIFFSLSLSIIRKRKVRKRRKRRNEKRKKEKKERKRDDGIMIEADEEAS